jgi:hypothetical protein
MIGFDPEAQSGMQLPETLLQTLINVRGHLPTQCAPISLATRVTLKMSLGLSDRTVFTQQRPRAISASIAATGCVTSIDARAVGVKCRWAAEVAQKSAPPASDVDAIAAVASCIARSFDLDQSAANRGSSLNWAERRLSANCYNSDTCWRCSYRLGMRSAISSVRFMQSLKV